MSYEPTQWNSGDIVTSAKLNKLEQGVANAGGGSGGVLAVNDTNGTLDKTWQEIYDAAPSVTIVINEEDGSRTFFPVVGIGETDGVFVIAAVSLNPEGIELKMYIATSADGYPVYQQG